jgi:hypothetical protein
VLGGHVQRRGSTAVAHPVRVPGDLEGQDVLAVDRLPEHDGLHQPGVRGGQGEELLAEVARAAPRPEDPRFRGERARPGGVLGAALLQRQALRDQRLRLAHPQHRLHARGALGGAGRRRDLVAVQPAVEQQLELLAGELAGVGGEPAPVGATRWRGRRRRGGAHHRPEHHEEGGEQDDETFHR